MAKRKGISKRDRFEVFKRDGFTCQYCGAHPPSAILHVDHIVPVAEGGQNDQDNLATACASCNLGKAAVPLERVPQSLAEKAAEVAEREAQLRGYQEILDAKRERIEDESWRIAEVLKPGAEDGFRIDYRQSIKRFIEQIGFHEVLEAAEIARSRFPYRSIHSLFRYFCGVCWKKIRGE